MVEAIQENAIAANAWLIGVMALFHITVMGLLGLAIWRAMTYREPMHEEFVGSMPHEHERPEAGPAPGPQSAVEQERRDRLGLGD